MVEGRGQAIDVDVLPVEVAIAEIVAVVGFLERAVVNLALVIGDAVNGRVPVLLMQIGECQAGRAVDAEGDRRSGAPPLIFLRSEEHTSELQSLMRNSYAVF